MLEICLSKKEEVTGGQRKLHNEELLCIVFLGLLNHGGWVVHATCMGGISCIVCKAVSRPIKLNLKVSDDGMLWYI